MGNDLHVLILPSWYFSPRQPWHGIFFREQALALQRAGMKVGVIHPELRSLCSIFEGALGEYRFQTSMRDEDSLPTLRMLGWDFFPRLSLHAKLWIRCAEALADEYARRFGKPDVIHAHSALWAGVAASRWSMRHGVPLVITEHSSGYSQGLIKPWQVRLARQAFSAANAVVAVSSKLARLLAEQGMVGNDCAVVPNVADTSFFTLPPKPRGDPSRVVAIAYMKRVKGLDVLLRAFAHVVRKIPNAELEIGGDGPDRGKMQKLAADLLPADRVRFLGTLDRQGVRRVLWNAHILAHPSRYETFGVVPVEAMATGLPVVATRCGGPEETVAPECGELVEADNDGAFAEGIVRVFERYRDFDPARIRRHVEERYSGPRVAELLKAVYERVLTGSPASSRRE